MLLVFFGGNVLGVSSRVWTRYFLALALLLIVKPQSVLNVGFVLSFMALFFILLLASQQPKAVTWQEKLWLLLRWQCCLSFLLMPVLYFYFQQWAFIAALCNLIAIPVVSLLIVPMILLALALFLLGFQPSWLWALPSYAIDCLMQAMAWLNQHLGFLYVDYPLSLQALACVFLAALCFCAQPKTLFRPLALVLLFVALLLNAQPGPAARALYIDVIDVGQGLSVLLQTANHNIVYDLGASWQGGSMFDYAVLPVLRARQVEEVDYLIISHHDNDHLGDYRRFLQHYPMAKVISSEVLSDVATDKFSLCAQGQSLHLDGVDFQLINPMLPAAATRNDNSCVVSIQAAGRQVLLSGDISARQERQIMQKLPSTIDVLLAPHHGSKFSSSQALVEKVAAGRVIFSAGYLSRFNHPHPNVVQRFKALGSQLHSTADEGLIHLEISPDGQIHSQGFRYAQPRYWRDATKL
jgi:competence protein ComEC